MSARDNGLRASAYAVLIEIEESLGDRLLSALAERQIAAYVVPSTGPGGATRLILHVDAQLRIPAGIVLAGLTPALAGELPAESEQPADGAPARAADSLADDAVFAELVAGFHLTPTERTWPDAEDLPDEPGPPPMPPATRPAPAPPSSTVLPFDPKSDADRRRPARPSRPLQPAPPAQQPPAPTASTPPTPSGSAADALDDEDDPEDHYIPPPLPRLDPPPAPTRWALLGLALGLAMLLVPTFLTLDHQTALDVVGVLCVLGSTGVLLSRLRDRSPDDPDDGAVV